MQNIILEQAKLAKYGADYMERVTQVKRHRLVGELWKTTNFICKKTSDRTVLKGFFFRNLDPHNSACLEKKRIIIPSKNLGMWLEFA